MLITALEPKNKQILSTLSWNNKSIHLLCFSQNQTEKKKEKKKFHLLTICNTEQNQQEEKFLIVADLKKKIAAFSPSFWLFQSHRKV